MRERRAGAGVLIKPGRSSAMRTLLSECLSRDVSKTSAIDFGKQPSVLQGLAIDQPHLVRKGQVRGWGWLSRTSYRHCLAATESSPAVSAISSTIGFRSGL